MKFHTDLTFIPLAVLAMFFFFGILPFDMTAVAMLAVGLPYGGPP